jgi:energy-coupling factor transporter ATP-binding protein EcfA2
MDYTDNVPKVTLKEFNFEDLPLSCTFVIIGQPGSGKSAFVENLCYSLKHRYPVAKVSSKTEPSNKFYQRFIPKLYISNKYKEDEQTEYIGRQKKMTSTKHSTPYSINIVDDCTDDPKIWKTKIMRGFFLLGSQHWQHLMLICSHYSIDMPPALRKSISYVAIFREPEEIERKKLYENYGSICGDYQTFCDSLDQITSTPYTCVVLKKRAQTNRLEDCVFWYTTKKMEKRWEFGCKEYKEHAKQRYNKNYIDDTNDL